LLYELMFDIPLNPLVNINKSEFVSKIRKIYSSRNANYTYNINTPGLLS